MPHCRCCDVLLSDYEATIKNQDTGEYLDMCDTCIQESGITTIISLSVRYDLKENDSYLDEDDSDFLTS